MEPVKFVALDRDDLEVVSTHLQDALVKVADVMWRPQEKRLVVALSRFDWLSAEGQSPNSDAAARRCASSASNAASAETSIPPARMRCSTCWRSNSARPIRPPES